MSKAIASLLLLIAAASTASEFHTSPYCWSEARIYAEESPVMRSVEIRHVDSSLAEVTSYSPNKAYGYHLSEPDRSESPWHTELAIYVERPYLLKMFFPEADAVRPEWVNEKLLFIRVWWGRVAGTDYLVDVEKETIVLAEQFRYGAIAFQQFQQCDTPQWKGSEACRCYPGQPEGWWPIQFQPKEVDKPD